LDHPEETGKSGINEGPELEDLYFQNTLARQRTTNGREEKPLGSNFLYFPFQIPRGPLVGIQTRISRSTNIKRLQVIQNKAPKTVYNTPLYTNLAKLHKTTNKLHKTEKYYPKSDHIANNPCPVIWSRQTDRGQSDRGAN
jgi:hypothetical protein